MIELMRNGGSADVFLHGEYGFSSVVNYCYSGEWLWNSRAKVCCMASGKKMPVGFHYRNLVLPI